MKKALSIILALVMAMLMVVPTLAAKTVEPAASAYAPYDKAKIASGDKDYIDGLTYDQIAGILLDWVDGKIATVAAGFEEFNTTLALAGMTVPADLDDIIAYKDYLSALEGDFAKLDTSALNKTRADGDINFIFSIIEFMAANSDIFGKVFSWNYNAEGKPEYKEGVNFDFGKVGEYITNPENEVDQEIVDFYNNYLIGNDIQTKFVSEIAREMGYTVKEGETFDDVINNGIKGVISDLLKKIGILSDEGVAKVMNDDLFNLRTTDVYALVKNLFKVILEDNEVAIKTYFTFLLDNIVRPAMKVALGCVPTEGAEVKDAALVSEFKGVYEDLEALAALGSKLYYQADDGKYYSFTVSSTDVTSVKEVTWDQGFLNLDPPEVSIGDKNSVIGTYTPTNPDPASYNPTVYTTYAQYVPEEIITTAGEFGAKVSADALPEKVTNLIAAGKGTKMQDCFKMAIGEPINQAIEVEFSEVEKMAEELALPAAQAAASGIASTAGLSITINAVDIKLGYTGYSNEDTFVCQVDADVAVDADFSALGIFANAAKSVAENAAKAFIQNPVATIVVENLNGSSEGIDNLLNLTKFLDTDFDVDYGILDFMSNYDTYKGIPGQANRILCDTLKMLLSDEGYSSLELKDGTNDNLTANIQKLCDKAGSIFSLAKKFMDEADFASFTEGLSDVFASSHGFNAGMVYNLDFSSAENLYVCAIRLGCDMLVPDNSGILYEIHEKVENLGTLDSMFVCLVEAVLDKAVDFANKNLDGFSYEFTPLTEDRLIALDTVKKDDPAKDVIMADLVDLTYYAATWAVPVLNGIINDAIAQLGEYAGIESLPNVNFALNVEKGANWEETLTNLVDRFYELTDGLLLVLDEDADVYGKISAVANGFLPLSSMLSNAGKNGTNGDVDVAYVMDVIFGDTLDGDFAPFLSFFEVKEDKIAGKVPVTMALINASEHMVDAVFPDTVKSEVYAAYSPMTEVQEYFTSSADDAFIASCNMKSINAGKASYAAAAFDLIRESGMLGFFVCPNHNPQFVETVTATCQNTGYDVYKCEACGGEEHRNETAKTSHSFGDWTEKTPATCTTKGAEERKCANCPATETRDIPALNHNFGDFVTKTEPTCVNDGLKEAKCSRCPATKTEVIKATGNHADNDGDNLCDTCGKDLTPKKSFFQKIADFFKSIIDWFKNLFK